MTMEEKVDNWGKRMDFEVKLDSIDQRYEEAYLLFKKIYDKFVESEEFKQWVKSLKEAKAEARETEPWRENLWMENLMSYHQYAFKIKLLRAYLGLGANDFFPPEWYTHEYLKG